MRWAPTVAKEGNRCHRICDKTSENMPNSLIPLRFMALMGHFVIVIVIFWSRDDVVRVCVDWDSPDSLSQQSQAKSVEMTTAFSLSITFVSIEILCFLSGLTMFYQLHCFFSFLCHTLACIGLGIFVIDSWECGLVWWIFALFTFLPGFAEILIFSSIIFCKRPF